MITVPAYMWLWSAHDVSYHHRRRYTARRLEAAVRASGWDPVVRSYFWTAMLPAVAAIRTARRRQAEEQEAGSDLALAPPVLNRVLELPISAEAKLIERGVRLPAGVSVGMVCTAR